jgi:hypothetical protein
LHSTRLIKIDSSTATSIHLSCCWAKTELYGSLILDSLNASWTLELATDDTVMSAGDSSRLGDLGVVFETGEEPAADIDAKAVLRPLSTRMRNDDLLTRNAQFELAGEYHHAMLPQVARSATSWRSPTKPGRDANGARQR